MEDIINFIENEHGVYGKSSRRLVNKVFKMLIDKMMPEYLSVAFTLVGDVDADIKIDLARELELSEREVAQLIKYKEKVTKRRANFQKII